MEVLPADFVPGSEINLAQMVVQGLDGFLWPTSSWHDVEYYIIVVLCSLGPGPGPPMLANAAKLQPSPLHHIRRPTTSPVFKAQSSIPATLLLAEMSPTKMDEKSAARIAKSRGKNDPFAKRADMAARNNKDQKGDGPDGPRQKTDSSPNKDDSVREK
ncbi:hypothetical protein GGR54DRAFT_636635 [Hypoxylon sp. NC1633]|nr:hypothetical protein GGR54DRAFT_636635 [Hypoxylon sp. NC1633]